MGFVERNAKTYYSINRILQEACNFPLQGWLGLKAPALKALPLAAGTIVASNGEVTAANNARSLESVASALDLLGVTRVELQLAKATISLAELY
jgi:hypothetical protein